MTGEKEYCYSIDEEAYHGRFASRVDAVGAACDAIASESDEGDYWTAEVVHPIDAVGAASLADKIAYDIDYRVNEILGEEIYAEDEPLSISKEDKEALGLLIVNFYRERAKIQYYGIANPEKGSFKEGSA